MSSPRSLNIPVISPTEICGGDNQEFPMFNPSIPVQDVLYNGQSLLSGNVSSSQIKVRRHANREPSLDVEQRFSQFGH